jgi:YD repeat-containing protein
MVNTPIEKIIFVNDQMVDHIKWDYALKDSMIVVQQSVERSFSENPTEVEASFPEYDTNGNPLQVIEKVVGFSKSYKWGYNGRYPIAEILNAEPNEVFYTSFEEDTCTSCIKNETKSKTGSSYFELSNAFVINSLPQGDYWLTYFWKENANDPWEYIIEDNKSTTSLSTLKSSGYIDELRCFPQDAQMTTFSYEPLIGISSRTDANGNTIYYNYDNIGRLVTIKDNNQKILKLIKYNYGD